MEKKKTQAPRQGAKKQPPLEFIPLGGVGEVGKNMYALKYGKDFILIDCGLKFPDSDMLGIDFVIPDTTWVEENKKHLKAIFITHGHEDHIGALPFVLPKVDVPVYGTRLTLALCEHKLKEQCPHFKPQLKVMNAGEKVKVGPFKVKFIAVCHSIPDSVALQVDTPHGIIIHTGDFKLDPTPVDGRATDFTSLSEAAERGVLLLAADSTNAERAGFTPSERTLEKSLERLLRQYEDRRVIISSFASNLHRVQLVLDAAARFNRKVAFAGRSMVNNVALAQELGYLTAKPNVIIPLQDLDRYEGEEVIVMTTGSQGEPFSGLVLMSKGQHHKVRLLRGDVVALFANPIPGNELLVSQTIDRLFRLGCEVLYEKDQNLHVSGHASREEMKFLLTLVHPKYFMPVHGDYRMQVRHGQLAASTGVDEENIFLMDNGDVWSYDGKKAQVVTSVPSGVVYVDGMALGEKESSLVRERQILAEDGLLVATLELTKSGKLASDPVFAAMGYVPLDQTPNMKKELVDAVRRAVKLSSDAESLKKSVASRCKELTRKYTRQSPYVMVQILQK